MRLFLAAALLLACPLRASADDSSPQQKAQAKNLYEQAIIHYRSGDLEKAAAEFKSSYQLYPRPETLFNLAQTHRLLKNYEKAIFYYKQYLASAEVNEHDRQMVQHRIADLENVLKQQQAAQAAPPQGPEPPSTTPANQPAPESRAVELTKTPQPAAAPSKHVYQRWWFWTALVGSAVVAGGAIGLGVGLSHQPQTPSAVTTNGTFHPF